MCGPTILGFFYVLIRTDQKKTIIGNDNGKGIVVTMTMVVMDQALYANAADIVIIFLTLSFGWLRSMLSAMPSLPIRQAIRGCLSNIEAEIVAERSINSVLWIILQLWYMGP